MMYRGVFVHIPKTGGTSIKAMFGDAVWSTGHQSVKMHRLTWIAKQNQPTWDVVYTFAFVRNPWDRIRAHFFHELGGHTQREGPNTRARFRAWLNESRLNQFNQQWPAQVIANYIESLDFIGQFEHFADDIRIVASGLGLAVPPMLHRNACVVASSNDWRDYYDAESHDLVAELGKWEIDRFGYTFDDCAIQHAA